MHKLLNTFFILGIWFTWAQAAEVSYKIIPGDTEHVEKTTIPGPIIEIIDINEVKNRHTDVSSNIEYKSLTCDQELQTLNEKASELNETLTEAEKLGVKPKEDVPVDVIDVVDPIEDIDP